jgi:outer membrane protein
MRSLITGLSIAAAMVLSPLAYANNVAVADSTAAVLSSNVAKQTFETLNTSLKTQRDRLDQLSKEIIGFQERFKKDGSVMSDKDKQALQAQAQSKLNEYNSIAEGVQRRYEETQSNMLKTLMPKLQVIINDLSKEGNYDLIVEKKYVMWSVPAVDLTKKITDRLNAAK